MEKPPAESEGRGFAFHRSPDSCPPEDFRLRRVSACGVVGEGDPVEHGVAGTRDATPRLVHVPHREGAGGVNSKPTSPTEAEIAAILAPLGAGAPRAGMSPVHARLYREWRGLIAALREFSTKHLPPHITPESEALEARMDAHVEIIEALADRILETPVRTWGDVLAYAEVCFWHHWTGVDPQGSDAEARMQAGPFNTSELCDEALAKVIKAIFARRPRTWRRPHDHSPQLSLARSARRLARAAFCFPGYHTAWTQAV